MITVTLLISVALAILASGLALISGESLMGAILVYVLSGTLGSLLVIAPLLLRLAAKGAEHPHTATPLSDATSG